MLLRTLKVAAVVLLFGMGGCYSASRVLAGLVVDRGKAVTGTVEAETSTAAQAAAAKPPMNPPAGNFRFTASVQIDGTGEPVAGAKVRIQSDKRSGLQARPPLLVQTDADGRFVADLPAGIVSVEIVECPRGYYWVRKSPGFADSFAMGAEQEIHREYLVRKGTTWDIHFTRGAEGKPAPGYVCGGNIEWTEQFEAFADERGQLHFTVPIDQRIVSLEVREFAHHPSRLSTGSIALVLAWEPDFQPAGAKEIVRAAHSSGYHFIDVNTKSAEIRGKASSIQPVIENGALLIRVPLPDRDSEYFGAVTGQVLDENDRPLPGVLVGIVASNSCVSDELRHHSTTTADGRYRLRDIPRRTIDGKLFEFQIVLAKEGYTGVVSPTLVFKADNAAKFQLLDPIQLRPGAGISGTVIDHRGRPVAGARVRANKPIPYSGLSEKIQTAWTDINGRFTLRDLRRGMALLSASSGALEAQERVMVGSTPTVLIQFPETKR